MPFQVNAKVRMGKSTTAILIGEEIMKLLVKHKKRPINYWSVPWRIWRKVMGSLF